MRLLEVDEDTLDSLAEDLRMKWSAFDFQESWERIEEEVAMIMWIMLRLGWKEGFNDCHKEWDLERAADQAIKQKIAGMEK
jgi:hypothetical protein